MRQPSNKPHPTDFFIEKNYLTIPINQLARMMDRSQFYVLSRMKVMGLQLPKEIAEQRKRDAMFKSGHTPKNKGKKTPEHIKAKLAPTWFKKGNLPPNTRTDGDESIRVDSNGIPYKYVRVALGKWEMEHRLIWEKHNGKLPNGCVIHHKDGNSLNNSIENLEAITRGEALAKNSGYKNLEDRYILSKLSRDRDLRPVLAQYPELIELKRNQLKLKRECHKVLQS